MGVDVDRVFVQMGDTELVAFGRGAFGTRGTVIGANAVAGADKRLAATILDRAAVLLQCGSADLMIRSGTIWRNGDETGLTIGEIARSASPGGSLFSGQMALQEEFVYDNPDSMTFSFGAHVARIAVNLRTGFLRLGLLRHS